MSEQRQGQAGSDGSEAPTFSSFKEFYPFYLREHANRTSRRLHVVGTVLGLALVIIGLGTGRLAYVLLGLVVAYGLAWIGHFFFEHNRPATFRHPVYSLMGDLAMASDILRGRIPW
ncbi:DUF962 domain-containing protein [Chelatococcus sp. SYSU_G07232]|uniref:DUF962 domain-containing protein n=1 Tax=Chelatococcus albus TaxID=3047466 RepID=A0ABT7ACS4_9HYPH|nr:DUF962 domain-containing protein [Chelatococcus sp. SYSU_G07232]MDJ1157175.1 DUF962 domain-containing protein [Chelatococcus sp. SYSU_G07232]